MSRARMRVSEGAPYPLGAVHDGRGVNFAVFSAHATRIEVCLFDADAVLMFNTGPRHGEATSTFTFESERLYHASLAAAEYRNLLDRYHNEVILNVANDARSGGRTAWLCRRKQSRCPHCFGETLSIAEAIDDGAAGQAVKGTCVWCPSSRLSDCEREPGGA